MVAMMEVIGITEFIGYIFIILGFWNILSGFGNTRAGGFIGRNVAGPIAGALGARAGDLGDSAAGAGWQGLKDGAKAGWDWAKNFKKKDEETDKDVDDAGKDAEKGNQQEAREGLRTALHEKEQAVVGVIETIKEIEKYIAEAKKIPSPDEAKNGLAMIEAELNKIKTKIAEVEALIKQGKEKLASNEPLTKQ